VMQDRVVQQELSPPRRLPPWMLPSPSRRGAGGEVDCTQATRATCRCWVGHEGTCATVVSTLSPCLARYEFSRGICGSDH
jgi:hypothetical protein